MTCSGNGGIWSLQQLKNQPGENAWASLKVPVPLPPPPPQPLPLVPLPLVPVPPVPLNQLLQWFIPLCQPLPPLQPQGCPGGKGCTLKLDLKVYYRDQPLLNHLQSPPLPLPPPRPIPPPCGIPLRPIIPLLLPQPQPLVPEIPLPSPPHVLHDDDLKFKLWQNLFQKARVRGHISCFTQKMAFMVEIVRLPHKKKTQTTLPSQICLIFW